jgi:tRNA(Ile)-lysidine synthase TilS/MesJ/rhodanese-related sulfurtransferase
MKDYWCTRKKGSVHMSITIAELKNRNKDSYRLIDIRDAIEISHGAVPDAIAVPAEEIETSSEVDKDKLLVIFCARGVVSIDVAEYLKEKGYQAESLEGGYGAWLLDVMSKPEEQNKAKDVELSLRKKFKKSIWSKFTKAINTYELVKPGDKIAVCISGGKDSMLMAKCFQELKLHNKFEFEVKFLVMDPGYSEANRKVIEENAKSLNIPITIFESDIFESVFTVEKSPCYLCARMRRGHLYHFAQELGCNKIALGHHYDDVIETILMGMLYGAQVQTMMPKLHSTNFEGMELIRPLYLVREDDIKAWRDYNGLHFIQCACKFTDTCTTCNNENRSKRVEIKELIQTLKQVNPYVEGNIFKSVENVNLDTVVAWKQHGEKHHFLDAYDRKNICTENDSKE